MVPAMREARGGEGAQQLDLVFERVDDTRRSFVSEHLLPQQLATGPRHWRDS